MKLETAQALKWPWWCGADLKNPVHILPGAPPRVVMKPSVIEMFHKMPVGTTLRKGVNGFTAAYRKDIWNKLTGWDKTCAKSIREEEADEALAQLCIWLRDNKLMEWKS